jgi:hypothetical protein
MGEYGKTVYDKNGYRVEWNGSATFNIYRGKENIDVWTEYGIENENQANDAAEEHMSDYEYEGGDATEREHWYTRGRR